MVIIITPDNRAVPCLGDRLHKISQILDIKAHLQSETENRTRVRFFWFFGLIALSTSIVFLSQNWLIQKLLKPTEHLTDFIRLAEVGDGIVDRVVVFQTQ